MRPDLAASRHTPNGKNRTGNRLTSDQVAAWGNWARAADRAPRVQRGAFQGAEILAKDGCSVVPDIEVAPGGADADHEARDDVDQGGDHDEEEY